MELETIYKFGYDEDMGGWDVEDAYPDGDPNEGYDEDDDYDDDYDDDDY